MSEIEDILKGYLRFIKPAGDGNISGPCPFHKGGMEKKPSFYMSTEKGLYFCHACGAKGTLPQFLKAMGASKSEIDRAAADIVFEPREVIERKKWKMVQSRLNEALLGIFDNCPTDLVREGFDKNLLQDLEIGFDKLNMRITFPLRDRHGVLVALIGRTVLEDGYPRYKCYDSKDLLEFSNGDPALDELYRNYKINHRAFLWNMQRVYAGAFFGDTKEVIVVEGYKACMWMIQNGFSNTVAIQGSQSTELQEGVLSRLGVRLYMLLDNNNAGRIGTFKSGGRLVDKWGADVVVCEYPAYCEEQAQPDNLDKEELQGVISTAINFRKWRIQWTEQNEDLVSPNEQRGTYNRGRVSREALVG